MSIETYQGKVENGQIKLTVNVKLPENNMVYVIVPDEKPKYNLAEMAARLLKDYQPQEIW